MDDAETSRGTAGGSKNTDVRFLCRNGKGHGTDRGLVAGLLGMRPDDERIPDSFEIARKMGLSYSFGIANLTSAHPNSVVLEVKERAAGRSSAGVLHGGGRIMINRLDGLDVNCSCEIPTLIVHNLTSRAT